MTSTKDVHDMLGLTADQVSQPKPKKKGKPTIKKPDGMAREVFSLLGERAPPIPIAEPSQYKAKRRVGGPSETAQWRETPFFVTSRNDGLLLRHWTKQLENATANQLDSSATPIESSSHPADTSDEGEPLPPNVQASRDRNLGRIQKPVRDRQVKAEPATDEYKFSKYDVQAPRPRYDDAVYDEHLKSDEWSREETDRLVDLYFEFYGKWPVIIDRWDYNEPEQQIDSVNGDSDETKPARHRSMEDLKARFYAVSAKLMELKTPVSQMSATEFANHEKMAKFDIKQEVDRKRYKETILNRSRSEKDEERLLLAELERMYKRQEQFEAEIRDLRQRLDHSLTDDIPNAQLYTSYADITGLFQKMIQRDKNNKLRRPTNDAAGAASSSPTSANLQNQPNAAGNAAAANQAGNKRSSLASQTNAPGRRALSPAAEARFGITTHDRLTFGVTFKSDRIAKARQAKSQSKTEKIGAMLTELGVPELIHIPTSAVCSAMEDLVKKINLLIDQRKVLEKQENDLKVAKELKAQREGNPADESKPDEQQQDNAAAASTAANQQSQPSEQQDQTQVDDKPKEDAPEAKADVEDSTLDESTANVDADGDVEVTHAPPALPNGNGQGEDDEGEEEEEEEEEDDDDDDGNEDGDGEEEGDDDEDEVEGDDDEDDGDGEEDAEGEAENDTADEVAAPKDAEVDTETSRPSTRGNAATTRSSKRSVSVLSEASTGSTKSRTSKRLKSARS